MPDRTVSVGLELLNVKMLYIGGLMLDIETIIQRLCQLESKFANLKFEIYSVNVEILRWGWDKIVEMLELWSVDICFL